MTDWKVGPTTGLSCLYTLSIAENAREDLAFGEAIATDGAPDFVLRRRGGRFTLDGRSPGCVGAGQVVDEQAIRFRHALFDEHAAIQLTCVARRNDPKSGH